MDMIVGPRPPFHLAALQVCDVADNLNSATARAVLENPSLYSVETQRAACLWLMQNGDWMDHERAKHLLAAILRDWDKGEQVRVEAKIWRGLKWLLALALAVALGVSMGMAVQKAMRLYAHDAAMAADRAVP